MTTAVSLTDLLGLQQNRPNRPFALPTLPHLPLRNVHRNCRTRPSTFFGATVENELRRFRREREGSKRPV